MVYTICPKGIYYSAEGYIPFGSIHLIALGEVAWRGFAFPYSSSPFLLRPKRIRPSKHLRSEAKAVHSPFNWPVSILFNDPPPKTPLLSFRNTSTFQ